MRFALLIVCLVSLVACGKPEGPDEAVRAVLIAAEKAAETRDVGAAMDLVSKDFRDAEGNDRAQLQQFVRGYFALNPRIELIVHEESVEFPEPNRARLALRIVQVGGRRGLDGERFTIELVDESGAWRLLRVERTRD
jgi:hypothetical protein